MLAQVRFRDMERSEALESFALEKIEPVVTEFLSRHDHHTQIWLISESSRITGRGAPVYRCEIDVRYPPKHEMFVTKTSADMYDAICLAAEAAKTDLRERSKKEIYDRKHAPSLRDLSPAEAETTDTDDLE